MRWKCCSGTFLFIQKSAKGRKVFSHPFLFLYLISESIKSSGMVEEEEESETGGRKTLFYNNNKKRKFHSQHKHIWIFYDRKKKTAEMCNVLSCLVSATFLCNHNFWKERRVCSLNHMWVRRSDLVLSINSQFRFT